MPTRYCGQPTVKTSAVHTSAVDLLGVEPQANGIQCLQKQVATTAVVVGPVQCPLCGLHSGEGRWLRGKWEGYRPHHFEFGSFGRFAR